MPSSAAKCSISRGTPNVDFDADPASASRVAIYDSHPYNRLSGLVVIGGTSLSAPCGAEIINCICSYSGT